MMAPPLQAWDVQCLGTRRLWQCQPDALQLSVHEVEHTMMLIAVLVLLEIHRGIKILGGRPIFVFVSFSPFDLAEPAY